MLILKQSTLKKHSFNANKYSRKILECWTYKTIKFEPFYWNLKPKLAFKQSLGSIGWAISSISSLAIVY